MLYIVKNSRSSYYINDILDDLYLALLEKGVEVELTLNSFPNGRKSRYILVPHEFLGEDGLPTIPARKYASRTIAFILENPGTHWFEKSKDLSQFYAALIFVNESTFNSINHRRKFLLNWFVAEKSPTTTFTEWSNREIDFLFVGGLDSHRRFQLAKLGPFFSKMNCVLITPNTAWYRNLNSAAVNIEAFDGLLRRSKAIINLHRSGSSSFEWFRAVRAFENNTLFITEPSEDGPVEGDEIIYEISEEYGSLLDLEFNERTFEITDKAKIYADNLSKLFDPKYFRRFVSRSFSPTICYLPFKLLHPFRIIYTYHKKYIFKILKTFYDYFTQSPEYLNYLALMRNQKRLLLDNFALQRAFTASNLNTSSRFEIVIDERKVQEPDISICIPFYKEGQLILNALQSVCNLETELKIEVLLCSDAGNTETLDLAKDFLAHTSLSYVISRRFVNGGVGATRNDLIEMSNSDEVLMLDADNELFPDGLQKLYETLNSDKSSFFAYGMLAIKENDSFIDILSHMDWEPSFFVRYGNYIDAFSLLKKSKIVNLGGYSEELTVYGWEDFDLWCRVANAGGHGTFHKNFVGIYNRRGSSMISNTNVDTQDARMFIRERSLKLFETYE